MARFKILQAKAGFSYERVRELLPISLTKEIREEIHHVHKYKRRTSVADTYYIVQSAGYQVEFEKSREVIVQGARQTLKKLAGGREAGKPAVKQEFSSNMTKPQGTKPGFSQGGVQKRGKGDRKSLYKGKPKSSTSDTAQSAGPLKLKVDLEGITQIVIDRRKASEQCLRCAQTGHRVRDCTNPKKLYDDKEKGKAKDRDKKVAALTTEKTGINFGPKFTMSPLADEDVDMNED